MILKNDKKYMDLAFTIAKMSKCRRAQYGSVLVSRHDSVIATGYNGKPRGACNDHICYREGLEPNSKDKPNCCLHSEVNVLLQTNTEQRSEGTLYVTGIPCKDCMLIILQSSISRLVRFSGKNIHKHIGDSDDNYIKQYGIVIDTVDFCYEEWYSLFDPTNKGETNESV